MKKPRIFIGMHYLEIGGAETALIGLLQTLDLQRVEVDLFLYAHRGEMISYIPSGIHLLPEIPSYAMIERPIVEVVKRGYWGIAFSRLWAKIRYHIYTYRKHPKDGSAIFGYVGRCVTPFLPSLKCFGSYDLAISFLMPHDVVLRKVSAKKKICWIHTDYTHIDVNEKLELPVWNGYHSIMSISSEVTHCFLQKFPSLKGKIVEIENILSPTFIRERAEEEHVQLGFKDEIVLLTIGRYSYPKKMEDIPVLCRLLREKGLSVKWYIIGYGGSDEYIRTAITENRMEEFVILLGKQTNPYPYIKSCEWYVQPSRYEGKSVVVREAQILCKPVIITNYPTASSQVQQGVDGVIVPMSVGACAEAMAQTLLDKKLKSSIIHYLSVHDYGNEREVKKIYRLMA
jgi:glycosyltransferase involved in cell wall biosynthesis